MNRERITEMVLTTQAMGIIPVDKEGNVLEKKYTWVDNRAEEKLYMADEQVSRKEIF